MDILIIGNGGREYSMGLALRKDTKVGKLYFAPGNGATDNLGTNIPLGDFQVLADFVKANNIELTIVGPEAPLVAGIVDVFKARGLNIFGPTAVAAQLEGSKIFMKNFLARHNIPTARYIETDSLEKAYKFIETLTPPIVVKADGLCGGKGVIIAKSHEEAKEKPGRCFLVMHLEKPAKLLWLKNSLTDMSFQFLLFVMARILSYCQQPKITKDFLIMMRVQTLAAWELMCQHR